MSSLAFYDRDVNREDTTCGVVRPNVSNQSNIQGNIPHSVHHAPTGRHLLNTPDQWTDCFDAVGTQNIYQGFAVDAGYYDMIGGTTEAVQDSVASVVATANNVFYNQINVMMTVTEIEIFTSADSSTVISLIRP